MIKRISIILISLIFCISIVGCGSNQSTEPIFSINDGTLTCTPNELIDYLNDAANEADCYTIPDFISDGDEIRINSVTMTLKIYCSDSNIKKIVLYWADYEENTFAAGVYCGALLTALFPTDSDRLHDEMGKIISSGDGELDENINGVNFNFWVFGQGGHRLTLTVE